MSEQKRRAFGRRLITLSGLAAGALLAEKRTRATEAGDDEIIAANRELDDKLKNIQRQIDLLEQMRNSPLDSGRSP